MLREPPHSMSAAAVLKWLQERPEKIRERSPYFILVVV